MADRYTLTEQIRQYVPYNAQEEKDRDLILRFIDENGDAFSRLNPTAHMTASAWVVNPKRDRVLAVYHRIFDSWTWTGGHADGDEDLLGVAVREVKEETGVEDVFPVSDDIFSLEILTVDGHEKNGSYVASHLHMNVTYLLECDDSQALKVCEEENKGVAWFGRDEMLQKSTEPWFVERIYAKLNHKLEALEGKQ